MGNNTIRDVAKFAGVSTATVSRVINGIGVVRPATKKKVEDAIVRLNYLPNETARNLKTESSKLIGLVVSSISNSHFSEIAKTVEKELEKFGYNLIVCSTEEDPAAESKYLQRLLQMQIDGLIINTTGKNDELVSQISRKVPVVLIDRLVTNPDFVGDFVGSNNYAGVEKLTRFLIEKGHKKIAGIFKSDDMQGPERYHGVVSAMVDAGLKINDSSFCWYDSEDRKAIISGQGTDRIDRFINKRLSGSTAVVCYNDEIAYTLIKRMIEFEKKVPSDISVVSFDNSFYSQIGAVPITSLGHKREKTGKSAAEMLVAMLNKEEPSSMSLKWELIPRSSG